MMKNYFLVVLLVLSFLFAGCGGKCNDFDITSIVQIDGETFLEYLEGSRFLSEEIILNLPDYEEDVDFLYWSKSSEDGSVIHKIEVGTSFENGLKLYKYVDYLYGALLLDEKLTLKKGRELAMRFIREFRPDLANLKWENKEWLRGNASMYDAGNVEAWVADGEYVVMVDLNKGLVVLFNDESGFYGTDVNMEKTSITDADEELTYTVFVGWVDSYSNVSELAKESDFIGIVEVIGESEDRVIVTDGPVPLSVFSVRVIDGIRYDEEDIEIVMTGTAGKEVIDDPLLKKGEIWMIFAKKNDDGTYMILGGPQGRFYYDEGSDTITSLVSDLGWSSGMTGISLSDVKASLR